MESLQWHNVHKLCEDEVPRPPVVALMKGHHMDKDVPLLALSFTNVHVYIPPLSGWVFT